MTGRVVHIFRRDLRLQDNTALRAAAETGAEVIPVFIFDPRQLKPHRYRSGPGLQFLFQSLQELEEELQAAGNRLVRLHGEAHVALGELLTESRRAGTAIREVFCNRDYTPFSRNRDRLLHNVCAEHGVAFHLHGDALLHEPEVVHKDDGTPYTVYTPFAKRALKQMVRAPQQLGSFRGFTGSFSIEVGMDVYATYLPAPQPALFRQGGRNEALKLLEGLGKFRAYAEERDYPALHATTGLSAHHKFGTVSVREVFQQVVATHGIEHTLVRELLWRDFFHHIAFHFPHVFQGAFHRAMDAIQWRDSERDLKRWQEGQTGFPIVDAGMRELQSTGFMHNRVRMIVASFLTKDLQIHWRLGEEHFARMLTDYDPCVNNGNWQWAASTGCDAQPYFRIFNPWLQQEKFDEDAHYIKRWVPELKGLAPKQIHALGEDSTPRPAVYPAPMVDHAEAKEATLALFAEARGE